MKYVLALALALTGGCKAAGNLVVVGSASLESERPEGKAVARVEVRYTPPAEQKK